MIHTVLITPQGLSQLTQELDALKNKSRPQLVSRLSLARSMGDLAENSDYQNAKEELAFTDGRISELEDLVRNAKVTSPKSNDAVDLGHSVTLSVGQNQAVFHMVGEWEADPTQKKISPSSPLGRALMGKKVGDRVEVAAPAGKVLYTIISIDVFNIEH